MGAEKNIMAKNKLFSVVKKVIDCIEQDVICTLCLLHFNLQLQKIGPRKKRRRNVEP